MFVLRNNHKLTFHLRDLVAHGEATGSCQVYRARTKLVNVNMPWLNRLPTR